MAKAKKKIVPKKPVKKPVKKKAPAKKKSPAKKKKVAKAIPNPHVGKRYFRIELAGYGGELVVAKASEEFVQYWSDESREGCLEDHIWAMNERAMMGDMDEDEDVECSTEGYDEDSPPLVEGLGPTEWFEMGDIEHDTMLSKEHSVYTVTEITVDPRAEYVGGELQWQDKYSSKKNFDWSSEKFTEIANTTKEYNFDKCVASPEMYLDNDKSEMEHPVPVMMLYDAQKGVFGHIVVQTNGEDFDPNKFVYLLLENTMSDSIQYYFYDKQSLSVDTGWMSTSGKGFHASVGYLEKWDVNPDINAMIEEGWKDLEE